MDKTFGKLLNNLRKEKKMRLIDVAKSIGVSATSMSRWENGEREPRKTDLDKLASALGVSVGYLMGSDGAGESVPDGNVRLLRVINENVRACCGGGNIYPDEIDWASNELYPVYEEDLIGYSWQAGTDDFAIIRAEGDSMEPHIHDGQRILFVKCPVVEPSNGDFVVALWCERLLIRGIEFAIDGKITLQATNEKYKEIKTKRGDPNLCVIGKVIGEVGFRKIKGMW